MQTHLEPLKEPSEVLDAPPYEVEPEADNVRRIVRELTGQDPRDLRFLRTGDGLVVHLTLGVEPDLPLAQAHSRASDVEARIRQARPEIADVVVHTEP